MSWDKYHVIISIIIKIKCKNKIIRYLLISQMNSICIKLPQLILQLFGAGS